MCVHVCTAARRPWPEDEPIEGNVLAPGEEEEEEGEEEEGEVGRSEVGARSGRSR